MEFLLPLTQNVALLALAALIYIAVPRIEEGWNQVARSAAIGLGLGFCSAMVMLSPLELRPGLVFDTRGAPVLLSGLLGGPLAALLASIPPIAMRIWIGGIGVAPGVGGMVVYALCSVAAWAYLRRRSVKYPYLSLLLYVAVSTVVAIPTLFLLEDKALAQRLLLTVGPILIVNNVAGTAILSLLVSIEHRRRRMIASLRESEAAAKRALEVRNRFIAMMSHELRTPLNAVLGYAQLLDDGSMNPKQAERLGRLSGAATALLRLIDDILQFSRFQSGSVQIAAGPVALPGLLAAVVDPMRRDAKAKGLVLDFDPVAVPQMTVTMDGLRTQQALSNMLSNALKFTTAGTIRVTADIKTMEENDGDTAVVRIAVSDTGIGIPADKIDSVYEPFERLGTTAAPGTGLGMSIVRAVVRAMGGSVTIESEPGQGTTVTLHLPAEAVTPIVAAEAPAAVEEPATSQEVRVLVVDDIEINTDIAAAFLEQLGCTVTVAANGAVAVELARANRFDGILMDLEMPVMDGLTATRTIRSTDVPEYLRTVPIIAVTAFASRADMQSCLEAGMNGYLSKPVDRNMLAAALEKHGVIEAAKPAAPAAAQDDDPVFSTERFENLRALIPAATLDNVLRESATQIEALGAQVIASSVKNEDRRQALHKLVSIAGNIGFLQLSRLSRRYQDVLMNGGTLDGDQLQAYGAAVEEVQRRLAELTASNTPAA